MSLCQRYVARQYSNDCCGQISLDSANTAKYSRASVASPCVLGGPDQDIEPCAVLLLCALGEAVYFRRKRYEKRSDSKKRSTLVVISMVT